MIEWFSSLGLCFFKNITGLPCPGCGMTRALLSALTLNFKQAFFFHPLFILIPIGFVLWLFRKSPSLHRLLIKKKHMLTTLIVLVLVIYAWRMFQNFPTTSPLDFNPNAIIPTLLRSFG